MSFSALLLFNHLRCMSDNMTLILHDSVDEINLSQWKHLVDNSAVASFFQTPECYDFYATLSFLKPFVYGVSENNSLVGLLCGYIISDGSTLKRFFSKRAIAPGGLLLDQAISTEALGLLLKIAGCELSREAIYIEIRNYNDYSSFRPVLELAGFIYEPHLNFHVQTPGVETAFKHQSSGKQRQVKQSLKAGASIVEAANDIEIKEYYSLLKKLYATKVKVPLFPLEFFIKLNKTESSRFLLIKYEGQITGGIVCVLFGNKVVYEWFVCGDDSRDKNVYSSVLATWAGIEYAAKNSFDLFDFMGAGKSGKEYGVRDFKSKFGGELVEHGRFLYICKPLLYSFGKLGIRLFKIL